MNWNPEIKTFIVKNIDENTDRLLLSAHRFPGIDVPFAVDQILTRRQLKNKLPEWYENADIILGGRIPAEQCSSELTARYKRELVVGKTLCDLTGGIGVDLYYMSRGLSKAIYTERQPMLCEAAAHNFKVLNADNIEIREGDGRQLTLPDVSTIYIDPARRACDGSRVYDLAECEPDVVEWHDELISHCQRLIVKMSPMADIARVIKLLPSVAELHVVAVKGECKEVLAVCEKERNDIEHGMDKKQDEIMMHCIDFKSSGTLRYAFSRSEEAAAESVFASAMGRYLYEPDVAVLKAGAYKSLCRAFDVKKLDVNSHLYTSDELRGDFPGRIFEIDETLDFSSKTLKTMKKMIPQANISARNFAMSADQLRARSGIKDGGEVYLFASALKGVGNVLMKCRKVALLLCAVICCLGSAFAQSKSDRNNSPETVEELLSGIAMHSPYMWHQGMEFVYMNENLNMLLVPEEAGGLLDTLNYRGSVWTFDAIVSEEDWMGQQTMALRFLSPSGKAFRYSTNRLMTQAADTTYIPAISGLYPKHVIEKVNEKLCARTLYILINDDRISDGDSLRCEKFVPVVVDSVTYGTELAPLEVRYTYADGRKAFLRTSLPGARENATSTVITRFLSTTDPYLNYPNISRETWSLIQHNDVEIDMTREECRLSLGKPQKYETFNTRSGLIERWFYTGGRVYEFWDGRLTRVGREK